MNMKPVGAIRKAGPVLDEALFIRFDDAKENLITAFSRMTGDLKRRLELSLAFLEAGSPLAAMERGFSVVINKSTGRIIRSSHDAKKGDLLSIRPLSGTITAITEDIDN